MPGQGAPQKDREADSGGAPASAAPFSDQPNDAESSNDAAMYANAEREQCAAVALCPATDAVATGWGLSDYEATGGDESENVWETGNYTTAKKIRNIGVDEEGGGGGENRFHDPAAEAEEKFWMEVNTLGGRLLPCGDGSCANVQIQWSDGGESVGIWGDPSPKKRWPKPYCGRETSPMRGRNRRAWWKRRRDAFFEAANYGQDV
eukprot:jgi/Undpi1/10019/HiC_scaffold_28.g12473.m1